MDDKVCSFNYQFSTFKKRKNLKQLLSPADLTDVQNKPIQFLDIDTAKNT